MITSGEKFVEFLKDNNYWYMNSNLQNPRVAGFKLDKKKEAIVEISIDESSSINFEELATLEEIKFKGFVVTVDGFELGSIENLFSNWQFAQKLNVQVPREKLESVKKLLLSIGCDLL